MAKNIPHIPYTEIQERIISIGRLDNSVKEKARASIQDKYAREIPSKFDWEFLITSSSLTTIQEYKTGAVTINTGDTTAVFSSDAVMDTSMTGRRIRISNNPVIYDITFLNTTAHTISPAFQGPTNISGGAYSIFQNKYALAGDFDRFPKTVDDERRGGGLYKWEGTRKVGIPSFSYIEATEEFEGNVSIPKRCRLVGHDTAGKPLVELIPPPKDPRIYGYDYIRQLNPLTETSAGTVTIAAGGNTVTGDTNCRFLEANTGDYFRINSFGTGQDSSWYRVISIAHNSSLTLGVTFANSGVTSAEYVISRAPDYPPRLQPALVYGPLHEVTLDQNDESTTVYYAKYAETLSDGKRIHVSRVYAKDITGLHEEYQWRR